MNIHNSDYCAGVEINKYYNGFTNKSSCIYQKFTILPEWRIKITKYL
jgi:hypothetical protein